MMTREEYELRKRRLEEQLAEGIELLRAGFRQQLRALELVWMTTAAEDAALPWTPGGETSPAPATPQPAKPARRPRQPSGKLRDDVDAVFDDLPRVFDRNDVMKALGYEPEPSSLHRVLRGLERAGEISAASRSLGKRPTRYEKIEDDEESGEPNLPAS